MHLTTLLVSHYHSRFYMFNLFAFIFDFQVTVPFLLGLTCTMTNIKDILCSILVILTFSITHKNMCVYL